MRGWTEADERPADESDDGLRDVAGFLGTERPTDTDRKSVV